MSQWYSPADTPTGSLKSVRSGVLGALAFAGWLGIPLILSTADHDRHATTHPIEIAIVGLLIGLALSTAWRFQTQRGWIAGPVLLVALMIEVAKRIALAVQGSAGFSAAEAMIALLIFLGLVNGIRVARARRKEYTDAADRAEL